MTKPIEPRLLDVVFGKGKGDDPQARAGASAQEFVRGVDMLAFASERAKGRRLTAREALDAYGFDKLLEVATEGSALICESVDAAGRTLRERREQLGLEVRNVASVAGLSREVIEALEASRRRPVREYERVARVLGLDERMLSFRSEPEGSRGVAVRLRDLRDQSAALSGAVVNALAEAAWVAATQIRLEEALGLARATGIDEEPDYGSYGHAAYHVGYELADKLRAKLGLGDGHIPSMRELLERRLNLVVIQAELGAQIAGATVAVGDRRAIVVNLSGLNSNAVVRRSTLAHEACHLLFDPRQHLRDLRVDEYDTLDRRADQLTDSVEQRANAFAIQLLAPQAKALALYGEPSPDPLARVLDHYGISFTAGRYQIWNGLRRAKPFESITTAAYKPQPDWEGREGYTTTYHPIRALAAHPSRAGRFSAVVARAAQAKLISWDTAGEWLFTSADDVQSRAAAIRELYPDVFA